MRIAHQRDVRLLFGSVLLKQILNHIAVVQVYLNELNHLSVDEPTGSLSWAGLGSAETAAAEFGLWGTPGHSFAMCPGLLHL